MRTDCLGFVEPMHAVVRGHCEYLHGRHGGLSRSHCEPEAEKAAPGESFGLVKRKAAIAICARTADINKSRWR